MTTQKKEDVRERESKKFRAARIMKQLALDDGGEQQSTTPTTSRRSTTCRTCLWLNALMGCVVTGTS